MKFQEISFRNIIPNGIIYSKSAGKIKKQPDRDNFIVFS